MLIIIWIALITLVSIKNRNNLYSLYLLIVLSVPANEIIYEKIGLSSFGISIIEILLIILFLISLKQVIEYKIIPFSQYDLWVIIASLIIILYSYIGYKNHNYFWKNDIKVYAILVVTYFVFRINIYFENNVRKYIKIIIYSVIIYSVTTLIIYIFKDRILPIIYNDNSLLWWGTKRVAFSNGCISLLLPVALLIRKNLVNEKIKIISILFSVISAIISQSRALILMYLVLLILALAMSNAKKNIIIIYSLALGLILFISTCMIFNSQLINYIKSSNNLTINRFSQLLDKDFKENDVRTITNEQCLNDIKYSRYLGFGLGKEMNLYSMDSTIASISTFIDNGIYTLMFKMGFIILVPLIIVIATIIVGLIRSKKINYNIKLVLLATTFLFTFTTGIVNAQMIYSLPISTITIFSVVLIQKKI